MNTNKKSHDQNVASMEVLTTRVSTYAKPYNPSENRLSTANQVQLKSDGDAVLKVVGAAENVNNNAIAARTTAFAGFDGFITRILNAVRISDAPEPTVKQFESMVRELRNKRATKIVPPVETTETTSDEPAKRTNAKHNSGMDTKIENFGYLIDFLKTIEAYHPNEQDLTIESLEEKLQTLKQTHTACIVAEAAAMAARLQRHILLYKDKTGLVPVGLDVKLYVKSAYGATSPEYKSISGIPFVRIE